MSMFTNKRIMVVAAHPDDELLGLGATMHKLIKTQGVQTRVIILGEGITSRSDTRDTEGSLGKASSECGDGAAVDRLSQRAGI